MISLPQIICPVKLDSQIEDKNILFTKSTVKPRTF